MFIESVKLKNFKSFKNLEMNDIPKFCVIVGANGVGKTTLFDVFGFLKDCLTYNVRNAIQRRGGFNEVLSRGTDFNNRTIEIEVKFRLEISGYERLVTYILKLNEDAKKRTYVDREILRYKRGPYGSPYHFLDFSKGKGTAIINEDDFSKKDEELNREEQILDSDDVLAIKGLGQFSKFKAASAFRQLIENWHVSDFHINAARGTKDAVGYEDHLSATGDNLQLVARNIHDNYPEIFAEIITAMKHRVPGVSDVKPISTQDGRLLLGFQDGSFADPFIDRFVSDGTLKMFAYLVQLHDPTPHPLLCVEEPENQLYPKLLTELAEEFRAYTTRGGQVFVSTHSPDFLNAVGIDEVFWLSKNQGYTTANRAKEDTQLVAYMNDGDKMGYLWKQGFFPGVDPQ
ncbi:MULTISPECIES: AAA family ATPase [Yersinia]|uniref:AAA family ATPase n=1 Tax=Yersinia TaxID=629 RepID=UPI0008FE1C1A|nr:MULTISPECIES: AAA family ATPase [Yersinia]EKN4206972.1 AAA family ATPase [Yersinia ruckeri]OJB82215.1 chromosome segregation protein SMC [Yersinia ruckeri]OJB82974.1 chromosome segregation protein SMC [Yersinia ruckeri]